MGGEAYHHSLDPRTAFRCVELFDSAGTYHYALRDALIISLKAHVNSEDMGIDPWPLIGQAPVRYCPVHFIVRDQHGKPVLSNSASAMKGCLVAFATLLSLAACARPLRGNDVYYPKCWGTRQPNIRPAVFAKCRDILRGIPTSSSFEPNMPLKFSPDPSQRPDIKLPKLWGAGNKKCTIALQFDPDRGGYDRLSLLDVQAAALAVAAHCVMRPPHMGGTVEVGWGKHMVVNVLALADNDSPADGGNGTLSSE